MMGVDNLAGLRVGVTGRLRLDRLLELAVETPEKDTRIADGLQRVPGHHHLRRRIRAELQMHTGDRRCLDRIGRNEQARRCLSASWSDEGGRQYGPSAKTRGGEQLATAEFEVEFGVLCSHCGDSAPTVAGKAYRNLMTVPERRGEGAVSNGQREVSDRLGAVCKKCPP